MSKECVYTGAKPFVKWAGGKGALIKYLLEYLPEGFSEKQNITYCEPFVGGGAMLFYILAHYPNISRAIISDVNDDLINCYRIIQSNPKKLIALLSKLKTRYNRFQTIEEKANFYYRMREEYNKRDLPNEELCACFLFLNKTCFNGLYRVNRKGLFNVPYGKYENPAIFDEELILADSKLLQKVEIYSGGYNSIEKHLGQYNFVYLDPPYRPLSKSSHFIEYTHNVFDDTEQEKLKLFCDRLSTSGCMVMQSNSNSMDKDGNSFFAKLYEGYRIEYIEAHRFINAHVGKRNKETELLIMNYNVNQDNL